MNIQELHDVLTDYIAQGKGAMDIVVSKDAEGNGFSMLNEFGETRFCTSSALWDLESVDLDDEDETAGSFLALVLWP